MNYSKLDPKGLIKDSYAIDGIAEPECRSIFLDWALGVGLAADASDDTRAQILLLLDVYAVENPTHPMTRTLQYGLDAPAEMARRGGHRGRIDN